jgi:hypothetical protein
MRVTGWMRMVAVAVLVVAGLGCIPNLARAEMGSIPDHPCAGPGCEQQIACGPPDQVTAPMRQFRGPIAFAVPAPIAVVAPEGYAIVVAPLLAAVGWQCVVPLAPRSPPAA